MYVKCYVCGVLHVCGVHILEMIVVLFLFSKLRPMSSPPGKYPVHLVSQNM